MDVPCDCFQIWESLYVSDSVSSSVSLPHWAARQKQNMQKAATPTSAHVANKLVNPVVSVWRADLNVFLEECSHTLLTHTKTHDITEQCSPDEFSRHLGFYLITHVNKNINTSLWHCYLVYIFRLQLFIHLKKKNNKPKREYLGYLSCPTRGKCAFKNHLKLNSSDTLWAV